MFYLEDIFFYLKKFFFHESQMQFLGRHQIGGRVVLRYKNVKITPQAWVLHSSQLPPPPPLASSRRQPTLITKSEYMLLCYLMAKPTRKLPFWVKSITQGCSQAAHVLFPRQETQLIILRSSSHTVSVPSPTWGPCSCYFLSLQSSPLLPSTWLTPTHSCQLSCHFLCKAQPSLGVCLPPCLI